MLQLYFCVHYIACNAHCEWPRMDGPYIKCFVAQTSPPINTLSLLLGTPNMKDKRTPEGTYDVAETYCYPYFVACPATA